MDWVPTINLVGALCGLALALAVLVAKPRSTAHALLATGLVLLAGESLCLRFSFQAVAREEMLRWQQARSLLAALSPGIWLAFSLTFARGEPRRHWRQWRLALLALGAGLPAWAIVFHGQIAPEVNPTLPDGNWFFRASPPGKLLQAGVLLSSVLVLTNLEWTFRAAVGTSRWRVKYAVLGLAVLFGARVYTSSHAVLYSGTDFRLGLVDSAALCLAAWLLGFSFLRSKLVPVDVYPSATALYKSLTVLLAGLYLFVVGVVAWLVRSASLPVLTFLLLLAAVGLGVLCLSDRVRQAVKRFVSLHLRRPAHDYRRVWSTFTDRTAAHLDQRELCREVARLISETFEALSVTVWLLDTARGRLILAGSTSLSAQAGREPVEATELINALGGLRTGPPQPVNLEQSTERWCQLLRQSNPAFFASGGERLCLPLVTAGEVLGFLVVGDRVAGAPFSPEDLELLKCLGEHLGAALRTRTLSEQLANARELAAFQAMSAFLVHDLKNTASTLSLMLRNMAVHYEKPGFREDALRSLSSSVQHINDLISRLTTLRQRLELHKQPCDLQGVIEAALKHLGDAPGLTVQRLLNPLPQLLLDPAQMESVLTNLLLNARDATGGTGRITIQTETRDRWAVVSVSDTGCGMTPEFLAHQLFKPFQTTKPNGLGIGMFQARTIVEAHGGRIEAQSAPGQGTTFRVWLPLPEKTEPRS